MTSVFQMGKASRCSEVVTVLGSYPSTHWGIFSQNISKRQVWGAGNIRFFNLFPLKLDRLLVLRVGIEERDTRNNSKVD